MQDFKEIIKDQKEFFYTGKTKDVSFRIDMLKRLKDSIERHEKEISEALYKDLKKSTFESFETEIGVILKEINHAIDSVKKWSKPKKVKTLYFHFPAKSMIYKEPYGVVFIISPWNYPFQLTVSPLIGAIASGNCSILTVSQKATNTSAILDKIISESFSEDFVKFIPGGSSVAKDILEEDLDYIFFTGSVSVGKKIMKSASSKLTPVTLELGGKSPSIVDKDTDISLTAKRMIWGKFINAGQTCIAPDYALVHKDIKNKLVDEMKKYIVGFYGENPMESEAYPRIVNEDHFDKVSKLLLDGKIIHGGRTDREELYIEPTLIDNVSWDDKIMEDEIFGPILPIIEYENIFEVVDKLQSLPKPLALYLFTDNEKIEKKVIEDISYGGGCVNDTILHLSSPYLPFGGVGNSGIGSYHGKKSFDTFTHEKSVFKNSKKFDLKFRYPPFSKTGLKLLKKVLK
ncbi:aldehyde dehydrogenase [Clostridium sp. D2Q-11]|uniref:Aldehyde dehydrogenase n=1 Tax=Anaeromonas frigoriresistens TaxID=2683708 RepID=A0A942UY03_9FIRM|nr:aldehyde dehydrogenase [Anaeromonas frigoriresistens]MBS4539051.1 aldehyde dehydrogenase [Anaeromonas frigoriresistens]